jgi:4-amino-4-deoxy-L-arabinose transferase-like glycosyltransferase
MFHVPLYFEALRSRPVLVFWFATLVQAALWFIVPLLFYSAPPAGLVHVLAVGRDFRLDGPFGPPLAYWLAGIVFRAAGATGVYALSQICVVATWVCVFALARAIVGATHAVMAVLLMIGISAFTVWTPDFGPPVLAMALWAATLLFYCRAVIEGRPRYWYALGVASALLLCTSETALVLLGTLSLFTLLTRRGRAALTGIESWLVATALILVVFAHLFWLRQAGAAAALAPVIGRLRNADAAGANRLAWLLLLAGLVLVLAGLIVLVALAGGWPRTRAEPAPAIARPPVDPLAHRFVMALALWPAIAATAIAVLIGDRQPPGGSAPLLVLSGLAVIVAAGDSIALRYTRILGFAWAGLLFAPALFVPAAIVLLPWTAGTDLSVSQPAAAMGRFFAQSFERRTGQPLAIVSGDVRTAELIALAAPSRPRIYLDADPARSPSVTADDIRNQGAVVVWPASEATAEPPESIKVHFPGLVAEVPEAFARPVRGRMPPLRIGWGMIRPAGASVAPAH